MRSGLCGRRLVVSGPGRGRRRPRARGPRGCTGSAPAGHAGADSLVMAMALPGLGERANRKVDGHGLLSSSDDKDDEVSVDDNGCTMEQ